MKTSTFEIGFTLRPVSEAAQKDWFPKLYKTASAAKNARTQKQAWGPMLYEVWSCKVTQQPSSAVQRWALIEKIA